MKLECRGCLKLLVMVQYVSFASVVAKSFGGFGNNKLKYVTTSLNDEGREVAVMDLVLEEGVDKWSITVVGHFVGFQMGYREIVMVTGWSYARVLVEVDAAKGLVDSVEIWYKSLGKSMVLNVEYVWRPSLCDHCKTFGHFSKFCGKAQVGMDKEIRGEVKQRSFNGYNGRGNMGYRGRDMYNNKGSNSFVSNEVKENVSKYVPVKNKEKVVNVDECLVTDEVLKSKPSSGADKLNKDDAVKDDLGKRGCNGKSTGVLLVVIHGVPIAEWGLLDCWSDDMIHLYKKKSASGTRSIADKRLSESLRSDESFLGGSSGFCRSFLVQNEGFWWHCCFFGSNDKLVLRIILLVSLISQDSPLAGNIRGLKNMKKHFRNMNRINGSVFDKVKALRVELKRVQSSLDNDPNCVHLREEEYVYCNAYKKAISDEEKVADLIDINRWKWPNGWNELFSEVVNVQVPNLIHDCSDKVLWFNKENDEVQFSVKEAWKVLRDDVPKVMWIEFQGVWNKLKSMCRLDDLSFVWAKIVSGIAIRKANNSLWSIISKGLGLLGLPFTLFGSERNFRLFWCVERSADKVFDIIVDTVRLRLLGLKIKRSPEVDKAATIWKLLVKDIGMRWDCRDEYDHNDDIT
ncbi:hypothetical protein Tco_0629507 [Tanacetum coccineum]|uniref:DUF4283 domain-containing protein n=1 Tax=Tanacetum coccineum TaxID=301880 RepID=A0ABQ4WTJ1_9ASTR